MAKEFTAQEYLDATNMLASITELVMLDRFWTEGITDESGRAPDGLEGLGAVVVQLERLLVDVELRARSIAAGARRRSASLDANFSALTADDGPFTQQQRDKVVELVQNRSQGDLLAFVDAALAGAAAQVEPERKALNAELERVRTGGGSNGDLSADEERALAELAILASVAFGPEAGIVVEAVGHLLDWLFG
jgi:hypothetical protein